MNIIKIKILNLALMLATLLLCGCYMHPYVFGIAHYPEGSEPDSAQYRFSIRIDGAKRHAYNDVTEKKIIISIYGADNTALLERQYTLQAGGLHWDVSWKKPNDLKIVLYDEQGLIELNEDNDLSHIPRQVFKLNFTFHPETGKFIEAYVPDYVKRKILKRLERSKKTHVVSLYLRIDEDNTKNVLDSLWKVAGDFKLTEKKVPNCMNCFVYFVDDNLEMKALHTKDSDRGNLVIEVVDWERKELSRNIVESIKKYLPIIKEEER